MAADVTAPKQRGVPFKPGQSGNPAGRPKGSRNQLGEDFLSALHEDFKDNGIAAIKAARIEDPMGYVKTIAGLLPKELNVNIDPTDEMTDAELIERIHQLDAAISFALSREGQAQGALSESAESKAIRSLRAEQSQDKDQKRRH